MNITNAIGIIQPTQYLYLIQEANIIFYLLQDYVMVTNSQGTDN